MNFSLEEIQEALEHSWGADTATGDGEWSKDNPSLNQCVVSALVVQDFFGGDLLRCEMTNGDSHYWNFISDGTDNWIEYDSTREQFKHIEPQPIRSLTKKRSREYVLSYPNTVMRYELLAKRVFNYLNKEDKKDGLASKALLAMQ